jgi:hypothetical protein
MSTELAISKDLLIEIKSRVRQAQHRAALSANAEMIRILSFAQEWDLNPIGPQAVAQLPETGDPIGIADYELTRALPAELVSSLPSIEALEAELSGQLADPEDDEGGPS